MILYKAVLVAALLGSVRADDNAGFDIPGEPGETNDFSDDPIYRIGDTVELKWHMNFTNALLKLVQTPSDHESTSSYIIGSPTNDTSYEWTVSYLQLNPALLNVFYFSIYHGSAPDASFISHSVNIVDADSTIISSSKSSSTLATSHTLSATIQTTTSVTSSLTSTTSSALTTSSATESAGSYQGLGGGTVAGITIGSTVGTLLVVGIVGWCFWIMVKKKRRTHAIPKDGGGEQAWAGYDKRLQNLPNHGYYHHSVHGVSEVPNSEIVELEEPTRR
ncbi:hypothetical protein BJ170DRAFT_591011 [Xylariales sp. AK1849]|nr:hypothetical protein BJ170DRAFT_591011 [Xylariales sp. AK1849]